MNMQKKVLAKIEEIVKKAGLEYVEETGSNAGIIEVMKDLHIIVHFYFDFQADSQGMTFQFFPGNVAVGYGVGGHRTATCIKGYGIQYHETEKIKEMLEWLRKYIAEKKSAARL